MKKTVVLSGFEEVVKKLDDHIAEVYGIKASLSKRKNVDGETATWVLVVTLSVQSLFQFLNFLKDCQASKQIKRIKIDGWEVDNPSPAMIKKFQAKMDRENKEMNE